MFVSFFSICMYRMFLTSSHVHGVITKALYHLVSVLLKGALGQVSISSSGRLAAV